MPELPKDSMLVVDLSCWVYRFHATCGGFAAGHVHAFFERVIDKLEPTHIAVAGDYPGPTFRKELYPGYKANRGEKDPELVRSLQVTKEMLEDINGVRAVEVEGYEADDIIATLVDWGAECGMPCVILGLDKDLMQLVTPDILMWDGKKRVVGPEEVRTKLGVPPHQVTAYQSLVGDSSDCVPGVRGIGPKKATAMLSTGKPLPLVGKELTDAALSLELVTLRRDVPLPPWSVQGVL